MEVRDYDIQEILPAMNKHVERGYLVFLKWTCPKCGERVTSDTPNCYQTQGYLHTERMNGEECGGLYLGKRFNYLLVLKEVPTDDTGTGEARAEDG